MEGQDLEDVQTFVYLGSKIAAKGEADVDVQARLNKALGIFNKLGPIWRSNTIRNEVKLRLYSSIVVPTAIYACETWRRTANLERKLNVFHRKCLRRILRISWRDHVTNAELLRRARQKNLQTIVNERRLKMAGHVMRLPQEGLREQLWIGSHRTYDAEEEGRRRHGEVRLLKTWVWLI